MANLSNINNKFIVEDSGDVGIGVTTATTKLHIGGTAPGDSIIRQDSTVSGTNWEIGERAAGKWQIFEDDGDSIVATFMSTGKVGIGTEVPDAKLQIQGNIKGGSASGSAWTDAKDDIGGLDVFVGSGSKALQVWDDNDQNNPRFVVERSGNVGIGTDSPLNRLFVTAATAGDYAGFIENTNATNGYGLVARTAHTGTQAYAFAARAGTSDIFVVRGDGNVGIGVDDPQAKLEVKGTSASPADGNEVISVTNTTGGSKLLLGVAENSYGWIQSAEGSTYRNLLLNPLGGNVGIGTDSPLSPLTVHGQQRWYTTNNDGNELRGFFNPGGSGDPAELSLYQANGTSVGIELRATGNSYLTGGNVGIGTGSPGSKLTVNKTKSGTGVENYDLIRLGLLGTGAVGDSSTIGWFSTNGTKTAGIEGISGLDNIAYGELAFSTRRYTTDTYLEAMRINNRGNVGIGYTSPDVKLVMEETPATIVSGNAINGSTMKGIKIRTNLNGDESVGLWFGTNGSHWSGISGQRKNAASTWGTTLSFYTHENYARDLTYARERMIIDSEGNVGIGTDSPSSLLTLNKATGEVGILLEGNGTDVAKFKLSSAGVNHAVQIGSVSNNEVQFHTANSEKMRITSAGDLYVGTTSTNPTNGFRVLQAIGGTFIQIEHPVNTSTGSDYAIFRYNQSIIGTIRQNGTSQVQYNVSSDYRLKEDLQDFAGLDMVSKIPVYDFKWKTDESRSYGVMAHELQEVLPDAVSGEKDAEEMQGVDYSKIVPLLVKSIQELKAEIELLKSK